MEVPHRLGRASRGFPSLPSLVGTIPPRLAGLTNSELTEPWLTNWAEKLPIRTIINRMVERDPSHTREINPISGLCHTHPTGESFCWIRRAETGE